ncbi:hypothetical protein VST7929_02256 [Vibrio stylophorae]|uniref:Insulinase family protein n=1 Tax=Vibrio stylophorae TaxID=659351 RepID=A0ABM8ZWE5_9VIBR|nr:pitrilysin family protein [Vibrio stylophorae]CAH0534333.1 hypothetical protein VST7929_02256 [Vibrio stylophorae]
MKHWLISIGVALALSGCSLIAPNPPLPQGVTLIESVQENPDSLAIGYQKYRLSNGLTVILMEDHSDPLVHVDVTYHVGSAREVEGKSGFAHFFEHMMFQGSAHVGDQQHFKIITEAGGTLNGTTNRDRTNYYETVPANQLEKVLWLESDRMGFLLEAVSQRKFEVQRSTVKNERAQSYENRPYGLLFERLGEAMYPRQHPYSWQTIGYVDDLNRVDVNDLKAFFMRWYGPNNAVLTIGGDIDPAQTLAWVEKYFGEIPAGPAVERADKWPVTLDQTRYITLEDRIIQPMVVLSWPTSYMGSQDDASLSMMADLLSGGVSSYLYQNMVMTNEALDVGAFSDCAELSCNFVVYAMGDGQANHDLAVIEKKLMQHLSDFAAQDIAQKDLKRIQGSNQAAAIFGLQSVHGKVAQLAAGETFFADPNHFVQDLKAANAVTANDVKAVYRKYLENKAHVVLSIVPQGKTQWAVAPQNYWPEKRDLSADKQHSALNYQPIQSHFDRTVMPSATQAVAVKVPELWQQNLTNGVQVVGSYSTETPTIQLQLNIPAGRRYQSTAQAGIAELTAAMMNESSQSRSTDDIHAELATLGSSVSFNVNTYYTTVAISSLTKNLDRTLAIVYESLATPGFRAEDFARVKKQALEGATYEQQRPGWLADQASKEVLYGQSIFRYPSSGTLQTLQALTLEDVQAFYRSHYRPQGANIVVVGDLNQQAMMSKLAALNGWQGDSVAMAPLAPMPSYKHSQIWLVDKPGAPQSVIRFVRRGLPFEALGEGYDISLSNFNLAGNFNSRINQNLREDKGYTYGAWGYSYGGQEVGVISFGADVRADATADTIAEIRKEMSQYAAHGLTDDEVAFMRLARGQQEALKYETPADKAKLLQLLLEFDLQTADIAARNARVQNISKAELNAIAAKWFSPSDYQIIVVADRQKWEAKLKALGLPVRILQVEK